MVFALNGVVVMVVDIWCVQRRSEYTESLKGKGSVTRWVWEFRYFGRKKFLDPDLSRQNVVGMPNE